MILIALVIQPAQAVDIPVEDEADYDRLLNAIRATEYTRQNYLETNTNPRMIAGLAGLWAYADKNPHATLDQLSAFVSALDIALSNTITDDPNLMGPGAMLTALSTTRVQSDPTLLGTDLLIGDQALALLGIDLPGLESYGQSQQRMAHFELTANLRWINQSEVADIFVSILAGLNPSGVEVEGLSEAAQSYLESLGYSPMLGMVDPLQTAVNSGLDSLPTYLEFVTIRDTVDGHLAVETEVFSRIDAIQLDAENQLDAIGQAIIESGLAINSVDLFAAAADPEDPDHAAAVAFLDARNQAIIDSFRDTADDRASVFARTLLLQQSNYPDVVYAADGARSFAGLQLQVNNELAIAQESVGIISSLGGLGSAYFSGNLVQGASSLAGVISGVFSVADALGNGPPSIDDQIFMQITGLRQQVEDLRIQMNERFDIVDAKLDVIFSTMISSFDLIQDGIETLIADIASVQSTLDRIEEALYGFAQNLLLVDLTIQTDEVLDYRNKTGFDLAYNNQSPSFVEAASGFTTFATFTSQTSAFAGVEDSQPLTLTIDNAADLLNGDAAVARLINEFRRMPTGLMTSGGEPVLGPISSGRTPAPAPWAQSASSYVQLAQESPWFFAYLLDTQQNSGGSNPPQIDQIIEQGERITNLAQATRGRDDLFNALLQRASDDSGLISSLIELSIDDELSNRGLSDGVTAVDPWGPIEQTASPVVPSISSFPGAGTPLSINTTGFPHRGYEIFYGDIRSGTGSSMTRAELAEHLAMYRATNSTQSLGTAVTLQPNGGSNFTIRLRAFATSTFAERTIRFRLEYLDNNRWLEYRDNQSINFYRDRLQTLWLPMSPNLDDGNLVGSIFQSGGAPLGCCTTVMTRVRVIQDTSLIFGSSVQFQSDQIVLGLAAARENVRARLIADLGDENSDFVAPSERLADTRALLDGYLTIGASTAIGQSEILRAALRGLPGAGGMWFDAADWQSVVLAAAAAENGELGGPDIIDVPTIHAHFEDRLDVLSSEVATALESTSSSFPYVEYVLALLRDLRDHASDLAVDDTFVVSGSVMIEAGEGLMSNDVGQEGRIDNDDLMVDLEFMNTMDYIAPTNGTVTVYADGSFDYTPDSGFEGTDSFNYRLIAQVGDPDNPVGDPDIRSTPATVVLRVTPSACIADLNGDGLLNFFDVSAFLIGYKNLDPVSDFNGDGLFNFFDVSGFLVAYKGGCP